jgi:ribosomal protein L24
MLSQIPRKIGEIKQFEAPIHHSNVKLNLKVS